MRQAVDDLRVGLVAQSDFDRRGKVVYAQRVRTHALHAMSHPDKKPPSDSSRRTLRAIAVFEATKGVAALAMLAGVIDLMHHDIRHLALELIGHFGWSPNYHYSEIILHYADMLPGANMQQLALLASAYASIRLLEAYGLWNDQAWSEWLGALSGGIYIPIELSHFLHRPSAINVAVLAGNIFLVGFLVHRLRQRVQRANRR